MLITFIDSEKIRKDFMNREGKFRLSAEEVCDLLGDCCPSPSLAKSIAFSVGIAPGWAFLFKKKESGFYAFRLEREL